MADQSEKPAANEQVMVRALYMYAAQLLADHTPAEVIATLQKKGLPLDSAQTIVGDLARAEDRVRRKMFRREALIGLGLLEAGVAVGLGAYLAVEQSGWIVWLSIAGLLVLLGGVWLARGLWGIRQSRRDPSSALLRRQSHES